MAVRATKQQNHLVKLSKSPTGIQGLDEITGGGLPKGRPTLMAGGAGCGKTLLAMDFLVQGATKFNEPGLFVSFEENAEELTKNFTSLGYDLNNLVSRKKLILDYIYIERSEIEVTGEYDLEGLFVRLQTLIDSIGAKRIVLDTLEALFAALPNEGILRAELRRLFRWLKSKGMTAVITAEKGDGTMTRHGLEEYVSDCVLFLDHIVQNQVATRRMRIVKYRGSSHGTNEYPFLIDDSGISVLPITSVELRHAAAMKRISSGIQSLDRMLGGKGFYRGSSVLITGTAGTGKSSMAAHFVNAVCKGNGKCLYLAFEESEAQIIRNMRSIGINLEQWVRKSRLRIKAARPTMYGIEMHLAMIHRMVEDHKPDAIVFDPITNLIAVADANSVKAMLTRLIDFLKMKKITALFTNLSHQAAFEGTDLGISSLMDVWISLLDIELNGERNRGLYILKSRGMAHSNQIREFVLTNRGIELIDVYAGGGNVLTGSARLSQEAKERAEAVLRSEEMDHKKRELERKRKAMETQINILRSQYKAEAEELGIALNELKFRGQVIGQEREKMFRQREEGAEGHLKKSRGGRSR